MDRWLIFFAYALFSARHLILLDRVDGLSDSYCLVSHCRHDICRDVPDFPFCAFRSPPFHLSWDLASWGYTDCVDGRIVASPDDVYR
jgi:hypothetical protein